MRHLHLCYEWRIAVLNARGRALARDVDPWLSRAARAFGFQVSIALLAYPPRHQQ